MPKTSQTPVNKGTPAYIHIEHGKYLSETIASLPFGMLNKQVPGIGATRLEIKDATRNSIIVFPTRALAATKSMEHGIFYVGSTFQGISPTSIDKILSDIDAGLIIKIAVVADSLIALYEKLKVKLHKNEFFIVLDEIDSFQTESNYRPKLEECIDIYLEFPPDRRCLVSATLEQFSDKRLKSEAMTTIIVDNYILSEVFVINATQSVIKAAADHIIECAQTGEKLFIAFNSIEGIRKILKLLPETLVKQSGILCSLDSADKIHPYSISTIRKGLLQHRITFLTSAYYVGLDVLEPQRSVKTIIVADTSLPVSLLSISKIRQIFGRVRYGACSNTIILNCNSDLYHYAKTFGKILKERKDAYQNVLDSISTSFVPIGLSEEATEIEEIMMDTCRIDNVCLLRRNNGKVVISECNVDHLKLKYHAHKSLYSNFRNAIRNLSPVFHVRQLTSNADLDPLEREKLLEVETLLKDNQLANRKLILDNFITDPGKADGKHNKVITLILSNSGPNIDKAKVTFIIKSLPVIKLKDLNKILFKVKVFSLAEDTDLWKHIRMHFTVGERYSSDDIHKKITQMRKALGHNNPFDKSETTTKSVQKLGLIFETKEKLNSKSGIRERLLIRTFHRDYCK
jgi:DEAD/DEAH box helicase